MLSNQSHINFLSSFFTLPENDRKEAFITSGFDRPDPASIADGFPRESLQDRKFAEISMDMQRAHNLGLANAYTELGIPVAWIERYKNPILSEKKCGFKQGMSLDMKFLKIEYDRLANTNLLNTNFNPDSAPVYLGYHTNINGMGFVIDLDFKENEKDATRTFLPWLEKNGIDPRGLPAVLTPGGGIHLYFLPYDGLHTSTSNFAPDIWGKGVDPRGKGAYVMAAGSYFKTFEDNKVIFKQYMVINNAPFPPLPQCIIDVFESRLAKRNTTITVPQSFSPSCSGNAQLEIACRILASKQEGERNTTLNKMAYAVGKMMRDGLVSESEARENLMQAAISTGLPESEVVSSLNSGLNAGFASPDPFEPFDIHDEANEIKDENQYDESSFLQPEKTDEEDFLKDKEYAALSYSPSMLQKFASRRGELTPERIDAIAKFAFPEKIYEAAKTINTSFRLDFASVVQSMTALSCQTLKGSRLLNMGGGPGDTMPASLFLNVIGGPTAGKSLLARSMLYAVEEKQKAAYDEYQDAFRVYQEQKAEYDRKKGKDMVKPIPPVLHCFFTNDATIEALLDRAQNNPEGILWYVDEGAGQANLGADRYNQKGSSNATAKIIGGYNGQGIAIERKNHDGMPMTQYVRPFALGIWINIQNAMLPLTYTKDHERQGYIQRFSHIVIPPKPQGKTRGRIKGAGEVNIGDLDFLDRTVEKMLDLRILRNQHGHFEVPHLFFTPDAKAVYDDWHARLTACCNHGETMPSYIDRFDEQVLRMACGLHYLHLASRCAENGLDIMMEDTDANRYIEKIDMQRAIAVADIFLKKLDEFLWIWRKPERSDKSMLNAEEEGFAKHVIANTPFYAEPRSAREIIECGYATNKTAKELCAWLKKEGFSIERDGKKGHRELKFKLMGLEPWRDCAELVRLSFTESPILQAARTAYEVREILEASDYRMSIEEFAGYLNFGDESVPMIQAMAGKRKFMIDIYDGTLLFRKESIDVIARFLTEEGEMIDGKLVGEAA